MRFVDNLFDTCMLQCWDLVDLVDPSLVPSIGSKYRQAVIKNKESIGTTRMKFQLGNIDLGSPIDAAHVPAEIQLDNTINVDYSCSP